MLTSPKFKFDYASRLIPQAEKITKGGQDAIVVSDNLIVVSDGVGGWEKQGVDPCRYPRRLCQIIWELYQRDVHYYIARPDVLLVRASSLNNQIGSATICILTLDPQTALLRSAYLGDSVYSIYRSSRQLFSAPQSTHSFNLPKQIGTNGDSPFYAATFSTQLVPSDIVIAGSDGLWDNIHRRDMMGSGQTSQQQTVQALAERIATQAYQLSMLQMYASPFYEKARSQGGSAVGGKRDDVTVVVGRVVRS